MCIVVLAVPFESPIVSSIFEGMQRLCLRQTVFGFRRLTTFPLQTAARSLDVGFGAARGEELGGLHGAANLISIQPCREWVQIKD